MFCEVFALALTLKKVIIISLKICLVKSFCLNVTLIPSKSFLQIAFFFYLLSLNNQFWFMCLIEFFFNCLAPIFFLLKGTGPFSEINPFSSQSFLSLFLYMSLLSIYFIGTANFISEINLIIGQYGCFLLPCLLLQNTPSFIKRKQNGSQGMITIPNSEVNFSTRL